MKKVIFLLLFFLCSFLCLEFSIGYAIQLDLKTCIQMGLKYNPKLKADLYTELSRSEDIKTALINLLLPDMSINRSHQKLMSVGSSGAVNEDYLDQTSDLTSFDISKDILSLFSNLSEYHRAKLEKKIAEYQKRLTTIELIKDISTTFYNILKVDEDIKSLNDAIVHLRVNFDYAKALFNKRLISYTDVLNAKVDLEDVKQKLSIEKNKKNYFTNFLKTLIGLSPDEKITLRYKKPKAYTFEKSYEECLSYAFKHRPEISILEFRRKIYEDERKTWLSRILPSLRVGINYNEYSRDYAELGRSMFGYYDRDFDISYWNSYVSMKWELNSLPRNFFQIKRTKFVIKAIDKRIEDSKNTIRNEVRTYYLSVKEALKRITTTKIALKAAEENYKQAEEKFRLLIGSISEVLEAQERLTRARANYSQAILDFQISLANLKYAMGIRKGEIP